MASQISFDLKSLEIFAAIVEAGGMTAAGQRLGITQSSVSQSLAGLEQSLHIQLLDRSQRPPMLTPWGRQFYQRATKLLDAARQVSHDFRRQEALTLKQVRIALVDSLATSVGRELLDVVKQRSANWSLVTGQSHRHAEALLSRKVDIIISDDAVANHPELYRHRIIREPFVMVVPKGFAGPTGSLRTLAGAGDFIRYSHGTVIGRSVEQQLQHWGITPPLRLQLDNSYAILSMVKAGVGWTLTTPLCLFQAGLLSDEVDFLPIPEGEFHRDLTLVAHGQELGTLPDQLSEDIKQVLLSRYLPILQQRAPWLANAIRMGKATD
ncbi:LysR family transcriptional regulator [Chitinimonas arctica]|uniref:LysR family transcriptional regulator n=1 Tax=Chitinimonas arctica TaxID=2594795 RepID=A0A516SCN7_9NEIS|nr:LysR family transcriptional regulator [Chitinimonas arctica]QDQ25818.1 LysR family transcriptional regulator [Chitinimonas arctica]